MTIAPFLVLKWRLRVNREMAARYEVDVATLGNVIQMATTGLRLADYRPDDAEDEVDIRLRLPLELRNLDRLENQTVNAKYGPVPIRNFTSLEPAPRRVPCIEPMASGPDGGSRRAPGYQSDERWKVLKAQLAEHPLEG